MSNKKVFRYTSFLIEVVQKLIGSRFSISGLENVPKDQPIMFVANHFTRSETFFVPYLIHKFTNRQVRSLAASELFFGFLGKFLSKVGSISVKDPNRNKIIVNDLIKNEYDWLIYPEGGMVKNKKISKSKIYHSHTTKEVAPVKTGSAVLALKSELYRRDLIETWNSANIDNLRYLEQEIGCKYDASLDNLSTYIVPLTISYYPIRPGENLLEAFAKKRFKNISDRVFEEIQIEGNLLSQAKINLHFGEPIKVSDFVNIKRGLIYQIPIIKHNTKTNLIIKYFKYSLTNQFMHQVYKNIRINFDHIFSAVIRHISRSQNVISIIELKRMIFLSCHLILKTKKFRSGNSLGLENLLKIFNDEDNQSFDSVFELARNLGEIILIEDEKIKINTAAMFKEEQFHRARIENTLQVIYNELSILTNANNIVKKVTRMDQESIRKRVKKILIDYDIDIYKKDYKKYFCKKESKPYGLGKPIFGSPNFLKIKSGKIKNYSILLCHGYKSSPKEMEDLSKMFNQKGFFTYCVRLAGHGTNPENIKYVKWQDWNDSLQRGYAILKNTTDKVLLVGFSTGGLLSLYNSSRKSARNPAVVAINPAIKLRDIRSNLVSTIDKWNSLLTKFNISAGKFEYVESNPENPELNYSKNYLKGVLQLKKLMKITEDSLDRVTSPALLIQASGDPVVNPNGAELIYRKIKSKQKLLFKPDMNRHVVVKGKGSDLIFGAIKNFFKNEKIF